mmetsp:Transcript_23427/g.61338  ORF Transcript_23427/g.61338 Transcript_23427/m.61338 type:complete len:424 (+) Transcript_23427:255-1526(+)
MGKKKGKSKKGSKKGSKKKAGATSDEAPPASERFVEHQLEARTAACGRLRDQRDELHDENAELRVQIAALVDEGRGVMERIRQLDGKAKEAVDAEAATCLSKVEVAQAALTEAEATNKTDVAELKKRAAQLEVDCSERAEYHQGLENHRRVLCAQWDQRLAALKERKAAAIASFDADVAHLEKQFKSTRARFDSLLSSKIEHAKAAASDAAITIQPVPDRLAYQDHGWLSYELEEQRSEYARLTRACAQLEEANVKLRKTVLGEEGERRVPPSRLGLRVRPISRQKSAPPALRMGRARTADPQFVTAAANLKIFSNLALKGGGRSIVAGHTARSASASSNGTATGNPRRSRTAGGAVRVTHSAFGAGGAARSGNGGGIGRQRPATEHARRRSLPTIGGTGARRRSPSRPTTDQSPRKPLPMAV